PPLSTPLPYPTLFRSKRYQVETSLDDVLPTWEADGHRAGPRAFLVANWSERPDAELLSGETRQILEAAIDRLPEHYRAVLILREDRKSTRLNSSHQII